MTPACIGIIMDGNRRFARAEGKTIVEGHRAGYEKLKEFISWAHSRNIKHVVAYAFSTENWQRASEEVNALLALLQFVLAHETKNLIEKKVRVRFVGDLSRFGSSMVESMKLMEDDTARQYECTLYVLLSYGGRAEIVAAAEAARVSGPITEDTFRSHLWTADMPDPELVIRTGGEKRLSNFLPWQTIYSELFFSDTFWPALNEEELDTILAEFSERDRRRGR